MSTNRQFLPGSTVTTTTVKSGPGGRKYTTRVEKSQPKYSFKVKTETTTQSAIPEEVELDSKHFTKLPGILKILQIIVAILCIVFFAPPLTWFTRIFCAVVSICLAITVFICLFYLFTLRRIVFKTWPWLKIETIYTNLAAASYLISSILQLVYTNKEEYEIALTYHNYYHDYLVAGVFGLINFVLYAIGGQLLHNKLKRQQQRQPKVSIIRTTLDRKGKPVKKTITQHKQIKIHQIA